MRGSTNVKIGYVRTYVRTFFSVYRDSSELPLDVISVALFEDDKDYDSLENSHRYKNPLSCENFNSLDRINKNNIGHFLLSYILNFNLFYKNFRRNGNTRLKFELVAAVSGRVV